MPFGLTSAPTAFMDLMHRVFQPYVSLGSYELGETEVSLRDTQFLGIGRVL